MLQSFVTCLGSISDSISGSILEQNRSQIDPQIESKMGRPAPLLEFLFAKHIFPQHVFFLLGGGPSASGYLFSRCVFPCKYEQSVPGPHFAAFLVAQAAPAEALLGRLFFTLAATARGKKMCFFYCVL